MAEFIERSRPEEVDPKSDERPDSSSPPPRLPLIPWRFVNFETTQSLVMRLNPRSTISGNDWRMLASRLGYSMEYTEWMESDKQYSNTEMLFSAYRKRANSSVQEVLKALEEMHRTDCVETIKDALPGIIEAWQRGAESNIRHLKSTRDFPSKTNPTGTAPCSGCQPYILQPVPPERVAPTTNTFCYGCTHSSSFCHYNSHSWADRPIPSSGPMAMGYLHDQPSFDRHHSQPNTVLRESLTPPMVMCPSLSQRSTCGKILNRSNCLTIPANHCNCHVGSSSRMECSAASSCGNTPHFNSAPRTCYCRHRGALMDQPNNARVISVNGCSKDKSNPSDNSKSITQNNGDINYRVSNNSRRKIGRPISEEHPINQMRPEDKRLRGAAGNGQLMGAAINDQMMGTMVSGQMTEIAVNGQMMGVDYEETGVEDLRFGDHSEPGSATSTTALRLETGGSQEIYYRSATDICDKSDSHRCLEFVSLPGRHVQKSMTESQRKQLSSSGFVNLAVNGIEPEQFSPPRQSDRQNCGSDSQLEKKMSSEYLEGPSDVLKDRIKPIAEYATTVVTEETIEGEFGGKVNNTDPANSSTSVYLLHSSSSGKRSSSTTSPMRVRQDNETPRAMTAARVMEEPNDTKNSKKFTPTPKNPKHQNNHKASRNTGVFVTYSFDSDYHRKQVLFLCKFLKRNHIDCSVDETEDASDVTSHALDMAEWCQNKFSEADFILVCVSHGYVEKVRQSVQDHGERKRLHTRQIFELMNLEFLNKSHQACSSTLTPSSRFIPLLFDDISLSELPQCMVSSPAFKWPSQYKKLVLMLRKSRERNTSMMKERQHIDDDGDDNAKENESRGEFRFD